MTILKEEINQSLSEILNLVKWKMLVLTVLTGIGLGLYKDVGEFKYGYLLLFMAPYVCAYIDLLVHEREARIHLIAKYLREYSGADLECQEFRRYEIFARDQRAGGHWLPFESRARLLSSILASVGIPCLVVLVDAYRARVGHELWLVVIPIAGCLFVGWAYHALHRRVERIDRDVPSTKIHVVGE